MRRALAAALMLTIGAVAGSAVAADSAPPSAAATDTARPRPRGSATTTTPDTDP
jgi:hypothetical protein